MRDNYRISRVDHICSPSCRHPSHVESFVDRLASQVAEDRRNGELEALLETANSDGRRIVIRNATIISMDPRVGNLACGDLLIEGQRIAEIAPRVDVDTAVEIDARDKIVIPGFCDPHIHCWEGALGRFIPNNMSTVNEDFGRPEPNSHPTRSYMNVLHNVFAPLCRPEDNYIGTLVTLLSALNGGITTVCDNAHNSRSPEHSDAMVAALIDSGLRGVHAYGRPFTNPPGSAFPGDATRLKREYFSSDDQLQTMRFYMVGRNPTDEIRSVARIRSELGLWLTFDSGLETQPLAETVCRRSVRRSRDVQPWHLGAVG